MSLSSGDKMSLLLALQLFTLWVQAQTSLVLLSQNPQQAAAAWRELTLSPRRPRPGAWCCHLLKDTEPGRLWTSGFSVAVLFLVQGHGNLGQWSLNFMLFMCFSFFILSSVIKVNGVSILTRISCLTFQLYCVWGFFFLPYFRCSPDLPWCCAQKSPISQFISITEHSWAVISRQ